MKKSNIIRYVIGIIFLIGGLGGIGSGDVLAGILTLLFGASLLPIVYEKLIINNKKLHIYLPIIMFVLMCCFMKTSEVQDTSINNLQNTTVGSDLITETQSNDTELNSQKDISSNLSKNEESKTTNNETTMNDILTKVDEKSNNITEDLPKVDEKSNNITEDLPKVDENQNNIAKDLPKVNETQNNTENKIATNKIDESPKNNNIVQNKLTSNIKTVYITPKGEKYHLDPECGGKNSSSTTLSSAESLGRTPCKKCAQ